MKSIFLQKVIHIPLHKLNLPINYIILNIYNIKCCLLIKKKKKKIINFFKKISALAYAA